MLTVSMDQMAIIGAVQSLAGLKRVLSAFESPEKKILVLPTMVNAPTNGSKRSIWEYDARTRAAEDYARMVDYFLQMVVDENEKDGAVAAKN